jgi:hypothetical protein
MSFGHATIKPITRAIRANRQAAKRHYGVHPYFTRRPPNVVRSYILRYSRPGDRVLDPFGGSGVTAIEAFLENRHGIQNDVNPLGNFIAENIADPGRTETAYIAGDVLVEVNPGAASFTVSYAEKTEEVALWESATPATPSTLRHAWSKKSGIYHLAECSDVGRIKPENLERGDSRGVRGRLAGKGRGRAA